MSYGLYLHPSWPEGILEEVGAVEIGDHRFSRERECDMVLEYEGTPCNDYRCSDCGKVHNAPRLHSYCPRCGARIRGKR